MANQLLCTFSDDVNLESVLNLIESKYTILYQKIFVLEDINNISNLMCTYNIDSNNSVNIIPNTIVLHRKKQTNTLYTINALNELIKTLNAGIIDIQYKINWDNYRNTIILYNKSKLNLIKIKIKKIIQINMN